MAHDAGVRELTQEALAVLGEDPSLGFREVVLGVTILVGAPYEADGDGAMVVTRGV